jgi:hypothetical protein
LIQIGIFAKGIPQKTTFCGGADDPWGYLVGLSKQALYEARKTEAKNDIGPPEDPVDPERYASCRLDLRLFLVTYFSHLFYRSFSKDQLHTIKVIQDCVLSGGTFAEAMPRGTGKTTIAICSILWAALYGHRRSVVILSSDNDLARDNLLKIKFQLETNDLLDEDFNCVTRYVRAIEGKAQRCLNQTVNGERTRIEYSSDKIKFPLIEGSVCAGSVIRSTGITGGVRGMADSIDGTIVRPDFVIPDDVQTRSTAMSNVQTERLEKIILGDVMGLAGHDKSIASVMPCTVIEKGDLSDRFLNHDLHPEWRGHRTKLVYKWPDNTALWEEYGEIRREEMLNVEGSKRSTEFYRKNRKEMDKGAIVASDEMHDEQELSAIQHAYNLLARVGERAFMAEYQNDPQSEAHSTYELTVSRVASNVNGIPQGHVSEQHGIVTVGADINRAGINWAASSFDKHMTAHVIDYGKVPERGDLWEMNASKLDIAKAIGKALEALTQKMENAPYNPRVMLVDRGYEPDTVHAFAEKRRATFMIVPSLGFNAKKYVVRMSQIIGQPKEMCHEYKSLKGNIVGHNACYWREIVQRAFLTDPGTIGSCSLYGNSKVVHLKFADQICNEVLRQKYNTDYGTRWEWEDKGIHDKLDSLVLTYVGASMIGIRTDGQVRVVRKAPPRKKRGPVMVNVR